MSLNNVYEILLILSVLVHIYFSSLLLGGFPMMVVTTWLGGGEGQGHLKDLGQKDEKSRAQGHDSGHFP